MDLLSLQFANEFDLCLLKDKVKKTKQMLTASSAAGMEKVLVYHTHYQKIKDSVEDVAKLFQSFWSRVVDENPDIKRIMCIIKSITEKVDDIEEHWEEMNYIDPANVKAIRFYSYFAHHILNDYDLSYSLYDSISKLKGKNSILGTLKKTLKMHKPSQYTKRDVPCIFVSTQLSRVGYISECNMPACRLLGVDKKKLIDKHINSLLPLIYQRKHDNAIREFIENGKKEFEKEIRGYVKHISGYIVPIIKRFAEVPSILNNSNFIITIEENKKHPKCSAFVITDNDYKIVGISSAALSLLNLHPIMLQANVNIDKLCPAIREFDEGVECKMCTYFYPTVKEGAVKNYKDAYKEFKVYAQSISMADTSIGHSIVFEDHATPQLFLEQANKKMAPPKFQFGFDNVIYKYVREYVEKETDGKLMK